MLHAILRSVVRFLARLRRYARMFGYARLLCFLLLAGMIGLRIADPFPLEDCASGHSMAIRSCIHGRSQRPVVIIDIDKEEPCEVRPVAMAAHA